MLIQTRFMLPGVGQFTIVDGEKVTAEDVGNNFFLERGRELLSAEAGLLDVNDIC